MNDREWVEKVQSNANADPASIEGIKGTFTFDFTKDGGEVWHMIFPGDGTLQTGEGALEDALCKISSKWAVMLKILNGELNGQVAIMSGKMKFKGDMKTAMQLKKVFLL